MFPHAYERDYGVVYISEIQSILARGRDKRPGLERITGNTIDISECLDFDFYGLVWYWDDQKKMDMTDEQACVGRWLGIAHRVGSNMTYWIVLTETGNEIARSTVQHVTVSDLATTAVQTRVDTFTNNVNERLRDDNFTIDLPHHVFYLQDADVDPLLLTANIPLDAEYGDMIQRDKPEADDLKFETFDQYIGAEFVVNLNGEPTTAKVTKRARDNEGKPVVKQHANLLLDSCEYGCLLEDGTLYRYNANVIAENIFAQCDDEGRMHAVLQEIKDHKKDTRAIHASNGHKLTRKGSRIPNATSKGWKLLCEWKDGSSNRVELRHLKDFNPIEVAEYAVANRLQEEPAFKWWVPENLRTRNRIISKVKSRYWKTSHKYGIRLPHSAQDGLQIDKETGTDFWWQAIQKEMKKIMVAFEYDDT